MKKVLFTLMLTGLIAVQALAQTTVYDENFRKSAPGFPIKENESLKTLVDDGGYIIKNKINRLSWLFHEETGLAGNTNFKIETSLELRESASENAFGIQFGNTDSFNGYMFYLKSDGYFLLASPDGKSTGWRKTTQYDEKKNELIVEREADKLSFELNGKKLVTITFQPFIGPYFGFYLSRKGELLVDDLEITSGTQAVALADWREENAKKPEIDKNPETLEASVETQEEKQDLQKLIKQRVEERFAKWAEKDEFETSADYQKRLANKDAIVSQFTDEALDYYKQKFIKKINFANFEVYSYDADAQAFKIFLDKVGNFYVKVPLQMARTFKENADKLRFRNMDFNIKDNKWILSYAEVFNPNSYWSYNYDITQAPDYNPVTYTANITGLNVEIPEMEENQTTLASNSNTLSTAKQITIGDPEVDLKIPESGKQRPNTYAIIIGNEDYTKFNPSLNADSNVDFARRDAKVFREYAEKTLGIPEKNIVFLTDAISSTIRREIKRTVTLAKVREGELIFYYAGHGFPEPETKDAYLMPVDVIAEEVSENGIALSKLYAQLSPPEVKKTTVFLDACFSGGGRSQGLMGASRFAKVKPNQNRLEGNIVVFSASSGAQVSKPYEEKKHGMFTYFLLKKLQESKGEISYGELYEYVNKEVVFTATSNYSEQTPEVNTSEKAKDDWVNWKF